MHIGHVAIQVPDIALTADHARLALDLETTEADDAVAYLTANAKHHELQVLRGARAGLDHIGLEVADSGELDHFRERALAAGGRLVSEGPEEPGLRDAFRVAGPGGVVFEIYTPMAVAELRLDRQIGRNARKIGHVTLFSDVAEEIVAFALDGLDFRISDQVETVTWMRCDVDHHGLAVRGGVAGGTALHHYAFELDGWDGMRRYLDELAVRGERIVWGPGRHGPGFNLYTYLPEPSGALIEGYADLQKIEDESNYVPVDWSQVPGELNLWGPGVPDGFHDFGIPTLG